MNYFERIKGAPLNIGKRKSSPRRMVRDVLPPNGRASLQQGGPPIHHPGPNLLFSRHRRLTRLNLNAGRPARNPGHSQALNHRRPLNRMES